MHVTALEDLFQKWIETKVAEQGQVFIFSPHTVISSASVIVEYLV